MLTWGRAEESGHGLSPGFAVLLEPRPVDHLPRVRLLRCGAHQSLACTEAGDTLVWGCGLTHQLGNRPRDYTSPLDKVDDPEVELRPHRVTSKQLEPRFVLLADGGAQHRVELAWSGAYASLAGTAAEPAAPAGDGEEPPPKRPRAEAAEGASGRPETTGAHAAEAPEAPLVGATAAEAPDGGAHDVPIESEGPVR